MEKGGGSEYYRACFSEMFCHSLDSKVRQGQLSLHAPMACCAGNNAGSNESASEEMCWSPPGLGGLLSTEPQEPHPKDETGPAPSHSQN